jgi:hypothetical protein
VTRFLAASDETSGATHISDFQYMGWLAPEQDCWQFFTRAWQERVLDAPPKIPYLHVTEMRSRAWRDKYDITRLNAEDRLNDASDIIEATGNLNPLKIRVDGRLFQELFQRTQFQTASGARKRYEPDYYAFVSYAYAVLCRVNVKFPDVEKVDFMVEHKSGFTQQIQEFYESLPDALRRVGRSDLISLLGTFISGSKEHVPLQAADFLCWHCQRAEAGTLDADEIIRWNRMARLKGFSFDMTEELMMNLANAFEREQANSNKSSAS